MKFKGLFFTLFAVSMLAIMAGCTQVEEQAASEAALEVVEVEAEAPAPEVAEAEDTTLTFDTPEAGDYTAAVYTDLTEDNFVEFMAAKPFALYFHADWCPTCRALEARITEGLVGFPDGATILKADFDTATELRDLFGVTMQSTIVVIDANGVPTVTLADPSNDELIAAIQNTL